MVQADRRERAIDIMPDGQERVCIVVDVSFFAQDLSLFLGGRWLPVSFLLPPLPCQTGADARQYKDAGKQPRQPMSVSLNVLHILQNHYVERLGRGLILNMPWFVNGFFKAISPFMDPITRDKVSGDECDWRGI